ncbi:MAG: extracellular solute-binding protein [Anaerolineae bacterium]|nr:extracellular solute-binding protein [Anaerolineae bacterium]
MTRTIRRGVGLVMVAALLVVACAPAQPTPPPTASPTPEPIISTLTPVAVETTEPPEMGRQTLRLWLVEPFAPEGKVPAAVFLEQLQLFRAEHTDLDIDVRIKASSGAEGVLPVLRSTASVAPSVLPDLVLLSRPDLISALNDSLIQNLSGRLPEEIVNDLFPVALEMVTLNGGIYGVPYTLDAQHLVYRTTAIDQAPATFADMLDAPPPYLFPAGNSTTVLGQYMAEGGMLVNEDGQSVLDPALAQKALRFYEDAMTAQLVQVDLLGYQKPQDYLDSFLNGQSSLANISTTLYLQNRRLLPEDAGVAPLPARTGPSVTIVSGWIWALSTADPDKQALALEMLSWLMRPENQGALARDYGMLPSQRAALRIWGDDPYNSFAEALLNNAAPEPAKPAALKSARALHEAMRSLLLERATAEQAATTAAESLATE